LPQDTSALPPLRRHFPDQTPPFVPKGATEEERFLGIVVGSRQSREPAIEFEVVALPLHALPAAVR
jgi:hypothetical protein